MKKRAGGLFVLGAALSLPAAFVGCSSDEERPGGFPPGSGSGSGGATSGGRGGSSSVAGSTSMAGSGADGGGVGEIPETCGDGVLDDSEGEFCDGDDVGDTTCADVGFETGELSCSEACRFVTDGCTGTERCGDAQDNDGDSLVDCADEEDCAEACAEPCSAVFELADPAEVFGTTVGRADVSDSSCSTTGASGGDMVYEFTAKQSGMVEIELETIDELDVIVRTGCGSSGDELACHGTRVSRAVTQGETVYIAVNGLTADDEGTFTLRASSRPIGVCADGYRDEGESCDDGNEDPLDGCDASCELESAEMEPNETYEAALTYEGAYFAEIDPADDVDFVAVTIAQGPSSLVAETQGFGDDCSALRIDTVLDLYATNGTTLLESDNDGGDGYCSRLVATQLAAGTYYVRISPDNFGSLQTYPYQLLVILNRCGNGIRGPGEQCDDGDTMSGDGCSATCQSE